MCVFDPGNERIINEELSNEMEADNMVTIIKQGVWSLVRRRCEGV